ncbi:LysE family translocator [Antarctobacter sp.]|uniref:LysE family translocator n=1 Tax=Antarctobacter sp. TaxID=1872577 RepID=UPI003A8F6387
MSFDGWTLFALFWVVFVTSPGPNAVNCIQNGMNFGFARALWGVAAMLTQAALFLALSALGVSALIAASPTAFFVAKLMGAGLLIWLGVRNWMRAARAIEIAPSSVHIYGRAFAIAAANPKSVAVYLAAVSQFVMPDVPVGQQMWVIVPTALSITCLSYAGYTALGAWLGRRELSVIANTAIRRVLAACFILYGSALGASSTPVRS